MSSHSGLIQRLKCFLVCGQTHYKVILQRFHGYFLRHAQSAADLVHLITDVQDARLHHLVQLPEQRRGLVDVLLGRFAQTIAGKRPKPERVQSSLGLN